MEVFLAAECIPSICEGEKGELARPHSGHSTTSFRKTDSYRVARCFDVGCSSQLCTSRAETKCNSCNHCGRTGYTGPTGRTGPRHDPPDPSAYSTHTSLARLAS